MKKTNWMKYLPIPVIIAILSLLFAISKTFVFDPLDRIEKQVIETRVEMEKAKIMLGFQQATLDKMEKKIP